MEELVQSWYAYTYTSDNRVLPKGTGYITDVGMTGYYDGILELIVTKSFIDLSRAYHKDMSFR